MLTLAALGWAQESTQPAAPQSQTTNDVTIAQDQGGWRRLGNAPAGAPGQLGQPGAPAFNPPPPPPMPATLTIAPGTFFSIRVNQPLTSDHNKVGDLFTASLAKPIVVNGIVVAERGQTVAGRVVDVEKGGLLKGSTKLGVELTELTLMDGTQVPVHSQLISISGPGVGARNVAVVGSTTAVGAVVGAAAGRGTGAAIGAGAGAAAGLIGVLASKGIPTVIHPESVLTFRMDQPIAVSTERAPQAFRYAGPGDFEQPAPTMYPAPRPRPYYGPGYYGPYPYYSYGYPFYPAIGVGIGFRGRWR